MGATNRAVELAAIIPAAGRSGRMGTPKQLLVVSGQPMLLGIVRALVDGGVRRVTVVVNPVLREKLPPLPPQVDIAINDQPDTEMIDSIRIGLAASTGVDGYLICPSDAAGLSAADVRRCVDGFTQTPDRIVIATHAGRRGHPMIFPASLAAVVRSPQCDAGLNQLAKRHPQLVSEVPCDSPGTTANVNTPADYQKLK